MEQTRSAYLQQIPLADWEKTPDSVKKLMQEMAQRLEKLEQQQVEVKAAQQQLLEKVSQTSKNSSLPPSQDSPGFKKKSGKRTSEKKRGGQPGHDGHSRNLYPIEKCSDVQDHHPTICRCCKESLSGEDALPYRHQIVEIPPLQPIVIEHRLHQLTCERCGFLTRATLPGKAMPSGYGVRVVACVALPHYVYRNSQRMVRSCNARLVWDLNVVGNCKQAPI